MSADLTTDRRLKTMLVAHGQREPFRSAIERLRSTIEQHLEVVLCEFDASCDLSEIDSDIVLVVGGDGSILRTARQLGYKQRPLLGVNLGKLGFLADVTEERFLEVLPLLGRGQFGVIDHLMFECRLMREGKLVETVLGLNEVAVLSGEPFHMLHIELRVDSHEATTYSCDGLIVSTPVGSTAHNLSAGGPILRKELDAFVISPISAHTLTVRPVVDAADREYELSVDQPNEGTAVVVDGQVLSRLRHGDVVRVTRAQPRFRMIEVPGHNYYHTLRDKLGWGGRLRGRDGG